MFQFSSFSRVAERVKEEAEKIGFSKNNLHVKKIDEQKKDKSHKKPRILKQDYLRYDHPSYRATHCHHYNANELTPNIWVGEGPYKEENRGYNNILRFCHSILQNRKIIFTTVVAIGPSYEVARDRTNFFNYLRHDGPQSTTQDHYRFTTNPIDIMQADYHLYTMQLTRKKILTKELALVHLPKMQDMRTLETSEQLIYQLILLADKSKNEAIFIHCSAGLGRSGTIAFALTLFLRHEELSKIDDKRALVHDIVSIWDEFNQKRPGTIQTAEQLGNALEIADKMWALKLRLSSKKESSMSSEASGYPSSLISYSSGFFADSARLSDKDLRQGPAASDEEDSSQYYTVPPAVVFKNKS